MIRRISTKLLLAVVATVALPFVGLAWFIDEQMAVRLSRDVVLDSLKGMAKDLAARVDRRIEGFRLDTELWAASPICAWAIGEHQDELASGELEQRTLCRVEQEQLDTAVRNRGAYRLILVVDREGRSVVSSTVDARAEPLSAEALAALAARDFSAEPWLASALRGEAASLDHHRSDLLPARAPGAAPRPDDYHLGFAAPVRYPQASEAGETVIGAVLALVDWSTIQAEVGTPVLKEYFLGLLDPGDYPSAYAWIWAADADTILAHDRPELYGKKVSTDVGLPQLVEAARASDWGLYPEYTFDGERKNAAFKRCAFGWVVGVGIDNDDIFQSVRELQTLLFRATAALLLVAVLLTMVIARRTTAPIRLLQEHARRVAEGDLDARVALSTRDELGELGDDLNLMTAELKEHRAREVRAEKDAAWREMARQVAHDIKNPLTPIRLSIDLLRRARAEKSPEFERIFDRTVENVSRQVDHLREIASDFHALTGLEGARREELDAAALLGEVLDLDAAWAEELKVEVGRRLAPAPVRADRALLRRVFANLVSNALEAMPGGGRLEASAASENGRVRIAIRDTGPGIPAEIRPRLFDPYFTTRSSGTGLGLAIAKRVVEDSGGTIALDPADPPPGTVARIELPGL